MYTNVVNLVARWLGLAVLLGLVLPAFAQRSIEFSTPVEEESKTPESFAPTVSHKAPSSFNAPKPLFGNDVSSSFDELPHSPVVRNKNNSRKSQEDEQNWALMTPQEILGVPTPESILGIARSQEETKLTPEERFLMRHDQQLESSATNGWHQDVGAQRKNGLWEPLNAPDDSRFERAANGSQAPGADPLRNLQLSGQDPGAAAAQRQRDTVWDSPFASATPPTVKPTTEQLQSNQRFLELLAPAEKAPAAASYGAPAAQPVAGHNPNFQAQPAYNPAGTSAKALQSDIAKPTGLTPLAGISGPTPVPTKRASLVKPPPWMADRSAESPPAQRQF